MIKDYYYPEKAITFVNISETNKEASNVEKQILPEM